MPARRYTGCMIFLHTFEPVAVAFIAGPITVYWYGIIMALAIAAATYTACRLAPRFGLTADHILDASFWLIVGGLIGARLYDVILEWHYYGSHLSDILRIWNGGLAIHGALIGGAIALALFVKRRQLDFWTLSAVLVPAVAIGQAIGRWGNWFNQELFGRPTGLPWAIPIRPFNRPVGFETFEFFHPTFLYESLGCLIIVLTLYFLVRRSVTAPVIAAVFCIDYGILRFILEFIKIDTTPSVLGLRWPQIASLLLILCGISILLFVRNKKRAKGSASLEMSHIS